MMKKFRYAIPLVTLILTYLSSSAAVTGKWILHPSLDIYSSTSALNSQSTNNIQKLMDGERYLYALVTSSYYANAGFNDSDITKTVNKTPLVIARLDKTPANGKIEPLSPALPLSGADVLTAEYSHQTRCLAVAYTNGNIDLIFDDGRFISNSDLGGLSIPGGKNIRSVSFSADGKTVSAAADFGFITLDTESGKMLDIYNFGTKINFANIVGDKFLAATDDAVYYFPTSVHPRTLATLPTLKGIAGKTNQSLMNDGGGLKLRYGIYPVDDRSFLFIGECYEGASGMSLNIAVIPENPSEESCMVDNFFSTSADFNTMAANEKLTRGFPEQGLVSLTRDGLMAHTSEHIYLIPYRKDNPDCSSEASLKSYIDSHNQILFKDPVAYTDIRSGQQKYKIVASSDGETFFYFVPRTGFIARKPVATDLSAKKTTWETIGSPYEINSNSSGEPGHLYYTPEYGLTVHNLGQNPDFYYPDGMFDGFCTYRNGVWTQRSLAHTNFKNGYMYGTQQVINLPRGAVHDPNDPKYVYTRGRYVGIRRENIEDPSDLLLLARSNFGYKVSYLAAAVSSATNSSSASFSEPDFDNNGTMWTHLWQTSPKQAQLWYWTAEDRAACKKAADYAAHPMKVIPLPGVYPSLHGKIVAGRTEKNKNIIFLTSDNYLTDSWMYDHNGTLDDTSDDRLVIFEDMIDENGDEIVDQYDRANPAFEDPYDGAFLFGHRTGMVSTTVEQAFDYEKPHLTVIRPVNSENGSVVSDFGAGGVTGITVDREMNKWVALRSGGLACLSPDRSKILAWYTTDNSGLPTNNLLSVVYNPETNSIFAGTRYGIAEFILDGTDHPIVAENPSVSPRTVQPHFNGYVTFSGLTDSKEYTLSGPDGKEILIGHPTEGIIQWHPSGYATGIYRLTAYPEIQVFVH